MNRGDYYVYEVDGLTYRVSHTAQSLGPLQRLGAIVVLYRPGLRGDYFYCAETQFAETQFKRVTDTTTILDLVDLEDRSIDKR